MIIISTDIDSILREQVMLDVMDQMPRQLWSHIMDDVYSDVVWSHVMKQLDEEFLSRR